MSSSAYTPAKTHSHLVHSPGGRAPAHCVRPWWVRTAQNPFGLAPYRRTQKHKGLVGSHRIDVHARAHEHISALYKTRVVGEHRTEVLTLAHELLCTRSHTRAQGTRSHTRPHSHMLPPTSRTPTREHSTGTSSLYSRIAQSSRGGALHRSPHSHVRAQMHAPLA